MSRSHGDGVYDVYLVETDVAGGSRLDSPVRTRDVRYYESGVWVRSDGSRIFYPYAQIRRIEERSEEETDTSGSEDGGPARSGDWRDDADPNVDSDDLGDDSVPADEL